MSEHYTVNDLGEAIAAARGGPVCAEIPEGDVFRREKVFDEKGCFQRRALAKLLARLLETEGRVRSTSNWWEVGMLHARRIIYSDKPRENFAMLNDAKTSLVLGDNTACPPAGWKGRTVLLSALLDIIDGEFAVNRDRLAELAPETVRKRAGKTGKNAARAQAKNARRNLLVAFTLERVHEVNAKAKCDPHALDAVRIPSVHDLRKWMEERHPETRVCSRTLYRDLAELVAKSVHFGTIWNRLDERRTYKPETEELLKQMIHAAAC